VSPTVVAAIADYEILEALPAGANGRTGSYLARRPPRLVLDFDFDTVVVKVLQEGSTARAFRVVSEDLLRFAALRSPYLVTLFEVGRHDGLVFCSMQHVTGGSLAAPGDPTQVLKAVADAARGAADLHAAGLVHGAITPSNVLVAPYGAKLAEPSLDRSFSPGLLVRAGAARAIEFADPALLLGEPLSPHHDVWSLGAVLHRVTAGVGFYGALPADPLGALRRVVRAEPAISPALPPDVADVVRACLAPPHVRPAAATVASRLARR